MATYVTRGIQQVKVPVSDLALSVRWYADLLDLTLMREFVEDGVVAGAVLTDVARSYLIGLRRRDRVPGQPGATPGFDLFSLGVAGRQDLEGLAARCAALGIQASEIADRGPDGLALDVPDPDGTTIRFLTPFAEDGPPFAGVEFSPSGPPTFYTEPRLCLR